MKHGPLVLALFLAACASPSKVPLSQPEAQLVPPQLGTATTDVTMPVHWGDWFNDPLLVAWINQALERNRDLKLALNQITQARASYRIELSQTGPTLSASASSTQSSTPASASSSNKNVASSRFDVGLSTSFELDVWGRLEQLSDAAKAEYLATTWAAEVVRMGLVSDVADAYWAWQEAEEKRQVIERQRLIRQQQQALWDKKVALGMLSSSDVLAQQALMLSLKADEQAALRQKASAEQWLRLLAGYGPPLAWPSHSLSQTRVLPLPAGISSEVLLQRPDIRAAEARLAAAQAQVGAARAAFFPRLSLNAFAGFASNGLLNLFSNLGDNGAWNFQPAITAPLFDRDRLVAGEELARARHNASVLNYEKAIQSAFRETAEALQSSALLLQENRERAQAMEAYRLRLELLQAKLTQGALSVNEVLEAERDFLAARLSLISSQRQSLSTSFRLYKTLGTPRLGER